MSLEHALNALSKGEFVLLHDSDKRENEVDLLIAAEFVEPRHIVRMRQDGGGLICVALHPKISKNFGLPYLTEVYDAASSKFGVLTKVRPDDLPYDEHSTFSLSVNHRRTFTGVTDTDRALTIRELGKLGARALTSSIVEEFGRSFRSPGHIPLLRAANGLLDERHGHTELSVALAELAGITPVVTVCEMLDAKTNRALSKDAAAKYAKMHGLVLLAGADLVKEFGGRVSR